MAKPDTRHLRVFVHVRSMPVKVAIEFPDNDLAKHYYRSAKSSKTLLSERRSTVIMKLPPQAVDLEVSRSLGAIVVHFDNGESAKGWIDDICQPVENEKRQVYLKQYWNEADFAKLRKTLREKWEREGQEEIMPEGPTTEKALPEPPAPEEEALPEETLAEYVPGEHSPTEGVPTEEAPEEEVSLGHTSPSPGTSMLEAEAEPEESPDRAGESPGHALRSGISPAESSEESS